MLNKQKDCGCLEGNFLRLRILRPWDRSFCVDCCACGKFSKRPHPRARFVCVTCSTFSSPTGLKRQHQHEHENEQTRREQRKKEFGLSHFYRVFHFSYFAPFPTFQRDENPLVDCAWRAPAEVSGRQHAHIDVRSAYLTPKANLGQGRGRRTEPTLRGRAFGHQKRAHALAKNR